MREKGGTTFFNVVPPFLRIAREPREIAGNVWHNKVVPKSCDMQKTTVTHALPTVYSESNSASSEARLLVVLPHPLQNALKAVLSHKKARRVDTSTSSGLKRLKTQNTTSGKRKGDALKGIPKSIHKRELILDEEEFDASSFGGDEGNRTPVRKSIAKVFSERSRYFQIPSPRRLSAGSAVR